MITFIPRHPKATIEHMGYFPDFIDDRDPRPAKEQINERYGQHGGWAPLVPSHWTMYDGDVLQWPEDPPLNPICELRLRDERIVMYHASIFAIIQPDGSFEVARCD
ncbi:hypothetical protein [Bradyrhizobium sp. S3.7.6]